MNPSHSIDLNTHGESRVDLNRLAVLDGTNAPLVSPENRRLLSSKAMTDVSPSKPGLPKTSTKCILDEAVAHLIQTEPKLQAVIDKFPCHLFSPEGLAEEVEPFRALVSSILAQQACHCWFLPAHSLIITRLGFRCCRQGYTSKVCCPL